MNATTPHVEIPGDRDDRIMARSGALMGLNERLAVWRFGFLPNSEAARAYGVSIEEDTGERNTYGFLWVLATRKQAKVKDLFRGYALELPASFLRVIDR